MAKTKKSGNPPRVLNILYLDDMIAAVEKPAGLSVQGGEGAGIPMTQILSAQLDRPVYPVHRLDKDTAGVLIVALCKDAASLYSEYFRQKRITKEYRAICINAPRCISGKISIPLEKRGASSRSRVVQKAETRFFMKLMSASGEFSFLSVEMETGRKHQIRRHFALEGFPIACDDKYGDFKRNREIKRLYGAKRLQLAATSIALPRLSASSGNAGDGRSPQMLEISCPLPPHMVELMGRVFGDSVTQRFSGSGIQ